MLAFNIQTLFYKIGASNLEFKQRVDESKGKLHEFEKRTQDNIRTLRNWGLAAGAAAGAVVYALNRTVQSTDDYAGKVEKLSEQIGITVEDMQALGYAAKQNESSLEELGQSMLRMTRRTQEAHQGNQAYVASYDRIGVSFRNVNGDIRATEEILLDLADAFAASNDENLKTQVAFNLLGDSGYNLIPLLNQGRGEIIRLAEEANRLGIVLSRENIAKFSRYGEVMDRWRAGMDGLKMQLGSAIVPMFTLLGEKAGDGIETIMEWVRENPRIVAQGIMLGGALLGLALAFGGVSLAITLVSKGAGILMTLFGLLTSPITGLILLAGLLYTAWKEDWGGIQTLVTNTVDAITLKWDELVAWWDKSIIGQALREWWAEVKEIWDRESDLTFGEKVVETIGLVPGLKWVPEFVRKLEQIWDDDDSELNFRQKVVETLKLMVETVKLNFQDEEGVRTSAQTALDLIFAVGVPIAIAVSYIQFLGIAKAAVMAALQRAWTAAAIGKATLSQGALTLAMPLGTLALVGALIWFSLDGETKQSIYDEVDRLKGSIAEIWSEKSLTLPIDIILELSASAYRILSLIDSYFDPRTEEEKLAEQERRSQLMEDLPPGGRLGAWWRRVTNNPHEKDAFFYPDLADQPGSSQPRDSRGIPTQTTPVESHSDPIALLSPAASQPTIQDAPLRVPQGQPGLKAHDIVNIENLSRFLESGGLEAILRVAEALNVAPETILAQWAIETSWFKEGSLMDVHNYGGMKAAPGQNSVSRDSPEYRDGVRVMENSNFLTFDSLDDFVAFFVESIKQKWSLAEGAMSPEEYGTALTDPALYPEGSGWIGKYATDPNYPELIANVQDNITKYLEWDELVGMAQTYGYDAVNEFVKGVEDGTTQLVGVAAVRFEYLMERWIHDLVENDATAQRWGYDVVYHFIAGVRDAVAEMGPESEAEFLALMDRWIHDKPENDEEAMTWGMDLVNWLIEGIKQGVLGTVDLAKGLFGFLGDSMMNALREKFPDQMAELESLLTESFGKAEVGLGDLESLIREIAGGTSKAQETAKQWTDSLVGGLSNAIGYGRGLKETFESVVSVFDNFLGMVASQFLQTQVLGPLFSKIGFGDFLSDLPIFHDGGLVLSPAAYYHSGGYIGELKSDEVPIIAQTGERVLSRQQNDQFENLLQNVSAEGNGAQQIEVNINAVDAASFQELLMRNPDAIKHLIIDDVGRNGPLRKILLQLARS